MANKFIAGSTFMMTVTLTNKTTGAPAPASEYQINSQVRRKVNSAFVADLLVAPGPGNNQVTINADSTTNWPQGLLIWDLRILHLSSGHIAFTSTQELECEHPATRL